MFMNWWEIYTFLKDEWHDFVLCCTLLCRVDSFVGKICKTKLQEQGQSEENSTNKDLQLGRWICRIHSGNSPHGNIYSRLDGGDQMSQINLFRALLQDSRQPSVTIPFVHMAVKFRASVDPLGHNMVGWPVARQLPTLLCTTSVLVKKTSFLPAP